MSTADEKEMHTHLEIHALIDGGYVIREGRFDGVTGDDRRDAMWNWRQERAAFTTLAEATEFIALRMVNKPSSQAPSMIVGTVVGELAR
jgi:hypothetical protein